MEELKLAEAWRIMQGHCIPSQPDKLRAWFEAQGYLVTLARCELLLRFDRPPQFADLRT